LELVADVEIFLIEAGDERHFQGCIAQDAVPSNIRWIILEDIHRRQSAVSGEDDKRACRRQKWTPEMCGQS
jgi:hypothetical protein